MGRRRREKIGVEGEARWLYPATDTESKCILKVDVYRWRGTDPAAAFLHRLTEVHDLDNAEFLVDGVGYLTALARHNLRGHLDYNDRNYIEKWFQTVTMRIDRFHSIWMGSSASARRWLNQFKYYYNRQRPNQALDRQTPAEEVLN